MITMNTKNLLLLASLTLAMPLTAQTPQEDFKRDITLSGSNYVVHLVANNQKRSVAEMYITINKKTHIPSVVKMRQGNTWSTITVSNFKAKSVSNSTFNFNSKECPGAEVIDLR